MAALLGSLVFAGQQTLLTTQSNLGAVNAAANLYSISGGQASTLTPHVALFQPAMPAQTLSGMGANVGFGGCTLPALLYTRAGAVTVWFNPNTTALPGEIYAPYVHSRVQ